MTRISTTTIARTSRICTKPPSVYELTIPSNHKITRMIASVQSKSIVSLLYLSHGLGKLLKFCPTNYALRGTLPAPRRPLHSAVLERRRPPSAPDEPLSFHAKQRRPSYRVLCHGYTHVSLQPSWAQEKAPAQLRPLHRLQPLT